MAQTAANLATAEAASKQVLVPMIHPDWTQEQVDEEVQRIFAGGRPGPARPGADQRWRARRARPSGRTSRIWRELAPVPPMPAHVPGEDLDQGGDGRWPQRRRSPAGRPRSPRRARSPCRFQPGGLHQSTGTPAGQKIPAAKMAAAKAGKFGPLAQKQANLAAGMLAAGRKTAARNRKSK